MEIFAIKRNGVPFFACDGFAQGVAHGFSTRLGGVSEGIFSSLNLGATTGDSPDNVAENFRLFCSAIGSDHLALVKNHQVHGGVVRVVGRGDIVPTAASGVFPADALVTNELGVALTVFSADCVPILMFDPIRRVIGAAHAGWRSTAVGIAANTVATMVDNYGCDPRDILVAIGPSISPCHFETHSDVTDGLLAHMGQDATQFFVPLEGGEKQSVDLKSANAHWVQRAGVPTQNIAISSACTTCDEEHFWSHRKLGTQRGSMASMIQLIE